MTDYRIIFEDPEQPEQPAMVLVPSDGWLEEAKAGLLPPISVYWALQDDEQQAITEGRHDTFKHDPDKYTAQFTAPRIGPLTEEEAKAGLLPPISVYWALQDDEQQAVAEGRHDTFKHDPDKYTAQFTAPRIGPLTEEEAIEYLVMKDIPRHIWSQEYNRPMFKIVKTEDVPSDRQFRNAWRLAA